MHTRTFVLLSSAFLITGSLQAQLQRIVLQGSGAPQVFTDLPTALAAAQPNDKLYFSGGAFSTMGSITINMPLHFIGAGVHPDSSSATSTTTVATTNVGNDGDIIITTAASGSTFTGIRFAPYFYVQYGTSDADDDPIDVVFERCVFDARVIVDFSGTGASSATAFNECIFHSFLYGATGSAATLDHCVLDYQAGTGAEISGFQGGGLTMRFCVGLGTRVGNCSNALIENSIFTRTSAPFWQSGGAMLTNNLCVSPGLTSNMTPGAAVGNVLDVAVTDIFISEDNTDFEWTDDLHLQEASTGVGMATDGTDVGIYGSSSPFKPGAVPFNPHFLSATIAPATSANGDLPVNIGVAAQTN
jgi:hypothetical protein